MSAAGLRAGCAAAEITPPAGVDLTGFAAREGPCTGARDPLQARALVFGDASGPRAALVTCDLIGLGKHLVGRVRRAVEVATGIPARAQLFNCSHTHAGPETGVLTTIGKPHAPYLADLEQRLAGVVVEAARDLVPVALRAASIDVPDGLAINRVFRRVGRPDAIDRQLTVVRVDRLDGAAPPLGTIVNFACHAVALGSGEREASADYVAPLRRDLEAAGTGPVLYVNGCGGDINPASMDARGRAACDALGQGLAHEALRAWHQASELSQDHSGTAAREAGTGDAPLIAAAQEQVVLPFQAIRSAEEAAELLAAGLKAQTAAQPDGPAYKVAHVTQVEYAARLLRLHYGSEEVPEVSAEVQGLRIGPLVIVALPGEIFSSLGQTIKAASPFAAPWMLVAGWSNDNVGYIPDRAAYPLGGYEVDSASRWYGHPAGWAPEAGDRLVAAAARLLAQVHAGAGTAHAGR